MLKTKTITFKHFTTGLFLLLSILLLPNSLLAQSVGQLQQQIDQKSAEIDQSESHIQKLRQRKNTLQNRLNIINAEVAQVRSRINVTENEIERTKAEIRNKEAELNRLKELIQENVRVLYKNGDPTTLELLLSSDNFSDFISKEEYLDSAKEGMETAAAESMRIKKELETKKSELNNKVAQLEGQRKQLAAKQNEQRQLIAETQGEENRYQAIVKRQRTEVEQLRQEQAAVMAAAAAARSASSGPNYSGYSSYPFPNASMAYNDQCIYYNGSGSADDGYGYCKRQCTSYVAWKLSKDGKSGFTRMGHAINWQNYGTAVSFTNARPGDVLVWDIGGYGHVMYVESANSSGVSISQYNVPYDSGSYSTDFYSYNELRNGVSGAGFSLRRF